MNIPVIMDCGRRAERMHRRHEIGLTEKFSGGRNDF